MDEDSFGAGGNYGQHPLKNLRRQIQKEEEAFNTKWDVYKDLNQNVPDDVIRDLVGPMREKPCVHVIRKEKPKEEKKEEEKGESDIIRPVKERETGDGAKRDVIFCGT